MANTIMTKKRSAKLADAGVTGVLAKIKYIALGTGGVNEQGEVLAIQEDTEGLKNEVLRIECTEVVKKTETSYEYSITLSEHELVGTYISEMALIDEDGDAAIVTNFLAKGKDDTEETYAIEDIY